MRLLIIFSILTFKFVSFAQEYDLGLSLGMANYNGDLSENLTSSLKYNHPLTGLHLRIDIDPVFSLKTQFSLFKLSGDDQSAKNLQLRQRDLQFESSIKEFMVAGQLQVFNLFRLEPLRISPYLMIGFGLLHFSPRANYYGSWVDLQPLGTEGQGLPGHEAQYSLWTTVYIFGGGVRYHLSERFSLSSELALRLSNSDYLDDASTDYIDYDLLLLNRGKTAAELGNKIRARSGSQRANPKSNDGYQSLSIGIHYHFGKNPLFKNSLFKNPVRCPVF